MDISAFEAATVYDHRTLKTASDVSYPIRSVVYNLDNYSVGLCTCSKEGAVSLLDNFAVDGGRHSFAMDLSDGLSRAAPGIAGVNRIMGAKLNGLNQKMQGFLQSERQLNETAVSLSGADLSCSAFEYALRTAKERVESLLSASFPLLEKNGFDEDSVRVILVGEGAEYYLLEFVIRAEWSFDPFLADERFVNGTYPDSPSQIIPAGIELYLEKTSIGTDISIRVLGRDGEVELKQLATRQTPASNFDMPNYLGPIFVSVHDSLELEVNTVWRKLTLPYSIRPMDSDLIEAAVLRKDAGPILRIRRCSDPTRIYDVPIP